MDYGIVRGVFMGVIRGVLWEWLGACYSSD